MITSDEVETFEKDEVETLTTPPYSHPEAHREWTRRPTTRKTSWQHTEPGAGLCLTAHSSRSHGPNTSCPSPISCRRRDAVLERLDPFDYFPKDDLHYQTDQKSILSWVSPLRRRAFLAAPVLSHAGVRQYQPSLLQVLIAAVILCYGMSARIRPADMCHLSATGLTVATFPVVQPPLA
jgi:hypothetical protein